ncbi:MAG: VOC family protein [Actinomycetota bacterium]
MSSTSPWWRLRQVALVAADLDAVEAELGPLLGLDVCFRDPGVATFGLHNALYAIGDCFLEVVSPVEEGTTAGRYLDRRGGDSGYMVILQTDDLETAKRRVRQAAARVVFTAEGEGVTGLHLHPRDVGGAILSLDHCDVTADWPWAGTDWRAHADTSVVTELEAVEIAADDPDAMADRWSDLLGLPLRAPAKLRLDTGSIRFVEADDRGEGVAAVELRAADRQRAGEVHVVAGTELRFV